MADLFFVTDDGSSSVFDNDEVAELRAAIARIGARVADSLTEDDELGPDDATPDQLLSIVEIADNLLATPDDPGTDMLPAVLQIVAEMAQFQASTVGAGPPDPTTEPDADLVEFAVEEANIVLWHRVSRTRSGKYRIRLLPADAAALSAALHRYRDALLDTSTPHTQRLRPSAYGTDTARNAAWASLCGDDLLALRLDNLDTAEALVTGEPDDLVTAITDEAGIAALMQSLNGYRLVLGTELDVSDDPELDMRHLRLDQGELYEFLGLVVTEIVVARGRGL